MSKKITSEKKNILGHEYTQFYDENGNRIGTSEEKNSWGHEYTQFYDENGNRIGTSEEKNSWGHEYTQFYDENGNRTGTSEEKNSWGHEYTQFYDENGNRTGTSEEKNSWGHEHTEYDGEGFRPSTEHRVRETKNSRVMVNSTSQRSVSHNQEEQFHYSGSGGSGRSGRSGGSGGGVGSDGCGFYIVVLVIVIISGLYYVASPYIRMAFGIPSSASPTSDPDGKYVRISDQVDEVNMRRSPGYKNKDSSDCIVRVPSGATIQIISGPSVADGLNWWFVSWNGYQGWMADHTGRGRIIMEPSP